MAIKPGSGASSNPADESGGAPPSAISSEAIKRILPWLVAVAFFMQALDTTILNTAVPAIAKALYAYVFLGLKKNDGNKLSLHKALPHAVT